MTTYQKTRSALLIGALIVLQGLQAAPRAATMTLAPAPYQTVLDDSGNVISGACVWTYVAGTSTAATTYTDKAGASPNTNPIVTDAAGRFVAYLAPGSSYKFVYENVPCSGPPNPVSHGTVLKSVDNIDGTPASSAAVDVTGTAGETISAGNVVYLSDGSGSKTQGSWYKADSANTYSSLSPEIGVALAAITTGTTGSIRVYGAVPGLAALTIGSTYYVGTAGALTATPPTFARVVGQSDSTTSIVLSPDPVYRAPANTGVVQGRLTLTTGTPVTVLDVTGAGSIFYAPYKGNGLALYDGSLRWNVRTFPQITLALSALVASQAYDVFAYDNAGTVALETAEWANATVTITIAAPGIVTWTGHGMTSGQSIVFTTTGTLPTGLTANTQYYVNVIDANTLRIATTLANLAAGTYINTTVGQSGVHTGHQPQARQTALATQDGVYVKTGATTRRYLGTFLTTGTGTTEDSYAKRFLWNYYNREQRPFERAAQAASWAYTLAAFHQANGDPLHQVAFVVGVQETTVWLQLLSAFSTDQVAGAITATIGIGEDAVTAVSTFAIGQAANNLGPANSIQNLSVIYQKPPTIGYHALTWLEKSTALGTTTWYSSAAGVAGLWGWIIG